MLRETVVVGVVVVLVGEIEESLAGFDVARWATDWKIDLRNRTLAACRVMLPTR